MNSKIFFSEKSGDFTINIPRTGFTINDANSEFSDGFFVYWTYPFEVYLSDELKRIFQDISNPNLIEKGKKHEGYLNVEGIVHPAILKLLGSNGQLGKFQFEFGIETLPSFDKKLSDFDLGSITTQAYTETAVYDYIDANLGKYYPEVNVFFPRIHTQKFDDKNIGNGFLFSGIYNDVSNGLIKRNYPTDLGFVNNGIVKPIVSTLHVINSALAEDGYTLAGEILEDEDFLYSGLDHNEECFDVFNQKQEEVKITVEPRGYNYMTPPDNYYIEESTSTATLKVLGAYYLSIFTVRENIKNITATALYKDSAGITHISQIQFLHTGQASTFDINLQTLLPTFDKLTDVKITITMSCYFDSNVTTNITKIVKCFLNPKRAGEITSIDYYQMKNQIHLNQFVPDITFGDLLKALKLWKKYKIYPDGKTLNFKKIEIAPTKVIDFQFSEQKDLEIVSNFRDAYLLKLDAPDEYGYSTYTIDNDQLYTFEKSFPSRTDVVIPGYPLPIVEVDSVTTAMEKTTDLSGVVLVKYKGLQSGKNDCLPLTNLLVENIYPNFYELYIKNRLAADNFKWSFYSDHYKIRELTSSDVIFAYNSNHKIINIIKKFVEPSDYLIEIETENRF